MSQLLKSQALFTKHNTDLITIIPDEVPFDRELSRNKTIGMILIIMSRYCESSDPYCGLTRLWSVRSNKLKGFDVRIG